MIRPHIPMLGVLALLAVTTAGAAGISASAVSSQISAAEIRLAALENRRSADAGDLGELRQELDKARAAVARGDLEEGAELASEVDEELAKSGDNK